MKNRFLLSILILLSLTFAGCSDLNGAGGKHSENDLVHLVLSVNTGEVRSLFPQGLQESDITKAELKSILIDSTGNEAGTEQLVKAWDSSGNVLSVIREDTRVFISKGKYKFTLLLYAVQDGEELLCQKGEVTVDVTGGTQASLVFNCNYVYESTGKFCITLKWNQGALNDGVTGVESVRAGLYTVESHGITPVSGYGLEQIEIVSTGNSAVYQKESVPCGPYYVRYELYDNANPAAAGVTIINTLEEVIYVYAACETTGTLMLNNVNVEYPITYETNGGAWVSGFTPVTKRYSNKTVILPDETKLSKTGRIFAGWYKTEDFSGERITEISYGTAAGVQLYARWFCPTMYVSETGLELNDGESSETALPSITKAISLLNDGAQAAGHLTEELKIIVSGTVKGSTKLESINGSKLTIEGSSASISVLDGDNTSDVLTVETSVPVEISNIKITNGAGTGDGGTGALNIGASATAYLEDVEISGNTTSQNGAGIYMAGKLYLEDTVVADNKATLCGAGIYLTDNAELYMFGSSVIGKISSVSSHALSSVGDHSNYSGSHGGGIYSEGGKIYLGYKTADEPDDDFNGGVCWNYSNSNGGGIYLNADSELYIAGGVINYNASESDGGAIRCGGSSDKTNILGSAEIKGNSAGRHGGAFYIGSNSTVNITDGTVSLNTAGSSGYGGAVYSNSGKIVLSGTASLPAGTGGKNDVYLSKTNTNLTTDACTVSVGTFTAEAPAKIAKITLPDESPTSMYQILTKVLSGSTDDAVTNATNISAAYTKFDLTQPSDGLTWKIISTGTIVTGASVTPVLSFAETFSDINVTFNSSSNTFTADSGYTNYEWYVNDVKKNTTSSRTFTVDTTGLSTGVYDIRMECMKGTEYYSFYGQLTVN